ncbi:MAG: DUF6597 domain-containing transcriptional factor [Planctomycetota bacterium]
MRAATAVAAIGAVDDGYRELPPPEPLRAHVECFWIARGASAARSVLPDGCVDFLFDRGDGGLGTCLVGAMTVPLPVPAVERRDVVAVRFRPGGAHAFVRADLHEFTDRIVELPALGAGFAELARCGTDEAAWERRLATVAAWLVRHRWPAAKVDRCLHWFTSSPVRVDAAAAALGQSRQHFARLVRSRTGLSPKLLARIARLRRALADDPATPAALLAARHGYADQAHLSRDARALGGAPLSALRG